MAKKFKSQWKIVSIDSIHPDPKNPRIIKDDDSMAGINKTSQSQKQ
jgi:hypothetical protein